MIMKALSLRSQIALAHTSLKPAQKQDRNGLTVQSQIALARHLNDQVVQDVHTNRHKPVTEIELNRENRRLLSQIEEIFIAGGGGAGRALPSALNEAHRFGLDLKNKVKVLCGTSVGTIACLSIAIGVPPDEMKKVLEEMPTDRFQDWNLRSLMSFFSRWGLCQGRTMPAYFRQLIHKYTGLEDPTFRELYRAGYRKELRIIACNVSRHTLSIFSHKTTPSMKVAEAVGIACSIPILFPPRWIRKKNGVAEAFTDGGIMKNYPFGIGSHGTALEKQLGFIFVNKGAAYSIQNLRQNPLRTLWSYVRSLITMLIFHDPLCLANNIKDRTVAIAVNHNPFKFTATAREQRKLDIAGREGVRRMLVNWIAKAKRKPARSFVPNFMQAKDRKPLILKAAPGAKQKIKLVSCSA